MSDDREETLVKGHEPDEQSEHLTVIRIWNQNRNQMTSKTLGQTNFKDDGQETRQRKGSVMNLGSPDSDSLFL